MSNVNAQLGRLERVEARDVWPGEASHFTPWLALPDNLRLLGETIGVELELEAQEKDVGPFRADILCQDVATNDWVLIENQLARTDHSHLGQLLTYAAGLKAVTIVWIANPFTDEHRASLDWLNDITDERFNFFGLEVELWQIGDSQVAPKFNVISKPNDWSRSVAQAAARVDLTESKQLQLAFWTAFRDLVLRKDTAIRPTKAFPQNWMNIAIGRTGFHLAAIASMWDSHEESYESNEVRVELWIDDARAGDFFDLLAAQREDIEAALGYALEWHNPPDTKAAKIYVRRSADLWKEDSWPELHEWILCHLENFDGVFRDRVRSLEL